MKEHITIDKCVRKWSKYFVNIIKGQLTKIELFN